MPGFEGEFVGEPQQVFEGGLVPTPSTAKQYEFTPQEEQFVFEGGLVPTPGPRAEQLPEPFSTIYGAPSREPGMLALPKATQQMVDRLFGPTGIPEGLDVDKLNAEILGFFERNVTGGEGIAEVEPSQLGILSKVTPGVSYTGLRDSGARARLAEADTVDEKVRILTELYGWGGTDFQGNLITKTEDGTIISVEEPEFTKEDIAEFRRELPQIAGVVASAAMTRGTGWAKQMIGDIIGNLAGLTASDMMESFRGDNLETVKDMGDRYFRESLFTGGAFLAGKGVAAVANRLKNPLVGGVTPHTYKNYEELMEMDVNIQNRLISSVEAKEGRQLTDWEKEVVRQTSKKLKFRPSIINDSPILARTEAMLAKIPGGAGVWQNVKRDFNKVIQDEVDELVSHFPTDFRLKERMAEELKYNLTRIAERKVNFMRSHHNARFTGVDPSTGGQALTDGVDVAIEQFKVARESRAAGMASWLGQFRMFDTKRVQAEARKQLRELSRNARGVVQPSERARELELRWYLTLDEKMDFATIQRHRSSIGDRIGGRDPTGDLTEARYKRLYAAMTEDIEQSVPDVTAANVLWGGIARRDRRRFVQEFQDFNAWYRAEHSIYNDRRGAIYRIYDSKTPDKLVDLFFRKGNATHVRQLKNRIPAHDFEVARSSAQQMLLMSKSGKALASKIDGIGDETMHAWFGPQQTRAFKEFAKAVQRFEREPLGKLIDDAQSSYTLWTKLIDPKDPTTFMQAKRALSNNPRQWERIQYAQAANMLRDSITPNGVLDGQKLLATLDSYEKGVLESLFRGTPLNARLRILADVTTEATKAEGGAAGGLAAGLFVISMITGNLLTAGSIATVTYLVSKGLASRTAASWLSNKSLGQMTSAQIRAATESMLLLSRSSDSEYPERATPQNQVFGP